MAHSSNLIIGSTFNSAQGDFHIHNRDSESGLHTLRLGVSLGAIHDSAERYPPPNCHPDTRKAVRQIILDWIQSESVASSFFWLYGHAGAGKTAILQAIAEFLYSPSGSGQNFGGSFFFSREKKGHDQGRFLFSTIAYQLALNVPGLRQHVNRIMELNPTLHTKSMDVQLKALILDAFQYLSPLPLRSYLVIIDGLDECNDKAIQQLILRLLCETITIHKLPLRFLIGSRPESHIRASFDQESLYTITQRVVLDETFNPGRDIQVFLWDGFAKICAENSFPSHVERPWPGEGIIDLLVQRSSGQFIYAATVLKFVGADFCSPTKQLALVLKPDITAFSDLDQLYTQILSAYPSSVNIVEILGIIIASDEKSSPEVIEDILGMEEGELKLVLRGLSSLMKDKNNENEAYIIPSFAHASFSDYLLNSSRSGQFHVNPQEYENQVTIRSFALIMQLIRSWRMSSIPRDVHAATWHYFASRLPHRLLHSPKAVREAIVTDIDDFVQKFWRTSSDGPDGTTFFAMIRLLKILLRCFNISYLNTAIGCPDLEFNFKFKMMFDGYRKIFDQLLPDVILQNGMSMQGITDLYMSGFLRERDRSLVSYWDPMLQHIYICRHFLSLLDRLNAFKIGLQTDDLADYVELHLYGHLCAATTVFLNAQNISDDHPAAEILHDLETTTYCVDKDLTVSTTWLLRRIIHVILRWESMLNCRLKGVAVSVSNMDLMERVCHVTNKIYREMLSIKRCEGRQIIVMDEHFTQRRLPDRLSWTQHCLRYRIVPSWYSLSGVISQKDGIPCSFTSFITTPELSGSLHISPDIYHTQITEYSLQTIYQPYADWCFGSDWSFREHLSCALPTKMIFRLLRSITSDCLIGEYSAELMLEIIINWLQGLGSERPDDLYDRFQGDLVRYKALHQSSAHQQTLGLSHETCTSYCYLGLVTCACCCLMTPNLPELLM